MYNSIVFIPTAVISMVFTLIIPLSYICNKKLRSHPSMIFVVIAIAEIISCYHFMLWITGIEDVAVFSNELLNNISIWPFGIFKITQDMLCSFNGFIMYLANITILCYNICFCIDFYVTLKYPLTSGTFNISVSLIFVR